jgi:hypothetical protein
LVGIVSVLVAGCASTPQTSRSSAPAAASTASVNVLMVSAVYDSGTSFVDVTSRVDDLLHQSSVEFFARPEWLHADPTPGWNKALVIVYEFKGRRHTFTSGEGGRVSLEQLIELAKKEEA